MASMRMLVIAQFAAPVVGMENSEFINAMAQKSRKCVKDNMCLAQGGHCCSGKSHGTLRCGTKLCEWACEKAVGKVIKELQHKGCAAIITEGIVECEVEGLGPENPASDICAAVVTTGCVAISKAVSKGIHDKKKICQGLHICHKTGKRCEPKHHAELGDTEDLEEDVEWELDNELDDEDWDNSCYRDGACLPQVHDINFGTCCSGFSHASTRCGSGVQCGAPDTEGVVV